MNPVTHENNRQIWLHAFGLTPWVATTPLAAAPAPSYLLDETKAPKRRTETPDTKTPVVPDIATDTPPATAPAPSRPPKRSTPTATQSPKQTPKPVVYLAGQTLLVVEQADTAAPELSREEQQLFRSLLHLFGDTHRHYPAMCPIDPVQAQASFKTFIRVLASQGCQQLLLCLSDDTSRHLLGDTQKFTPFQIHNITALRIASLADMLSAPLEQKKASWAAICEAHFVGSR